MLIELQPSTGTMPLDGAIPLFGHADTAGIFSRDPKDFTNLLRAW
jgi:Asp-tRNA(Asn)/Glu-tRNA(Gln) amidotransferase A subunit family amidase